MSRDLARRRALRQFGRKLGLKEAAQAECSLLDIALTHDSYAAQPAGAGSLGHPSNERLEFLGDAVLGAAVAHAVFSRHPDKAEGKLSPLRASLVSRPALAQTARRLGIATLLLLGKGERAAGGAERPSILAGAFEAIVGAVYLCEGFEAARRFVEREHLAHVKPAQALDPKTALQEYSQAKFKQAPHYAVTAQNGPPHERTFTVTVAIGADVVGSGNGATKKEAEAAAARQALQKVRAARPPDLR